MKRAQISAVTKSQWVRCGNMTNAPTAPQSCRGRGKAAGMGRHSPGHVCRRPRQQHSHVNRSCSQPCRHQQDQQIQPAIRNSHVQSSDYRDSRRHEAVELGRRATIITGDSVETTYLFHQLSVALQKKEMRSPFRTCSQPAILSLTMQLFTPL